MNPYLKSKIRRKLRGQLRRIRVNQFMRRVRGGKYEDIWNAVAEFAGHLPQNPETTLLRRDGLGSYNR